MGKKKDLELITVSGIDPGALNALIGGARRNRSAQTKKQAYDAERIRVRIDVPEFVRDLLRAEAKEWGTSVNDFGVFLLIYALVLYFEGGEIEESIEASKVFSKSPKKEIAICHDVVLERLREAVAKAAKERPSVKTAGDDGADGGAKGWGDWLKA